MTHLLPAGTIKSPLVRQMLALGFDKVNGMFNTNREAHSGLSYMAILQFRHNASLAPLED
jgi:hypothetical protein